MQLFLVSYVKADDVRKGEKVGFYYNNSFLDVGVAKCKHFYSMCITLKASLTNGAKRLQQNLMLLVKSYPRSTFYLLKSVWKHF